MAAFQYQIHHLNSFHLDSVFMPGSNNIKMSGLLEEPNNTSTSTIVPNCINSKSYQPESFILEMDSSSVIDKREGVEQVNSMDRKRKSSEGSSNSMSSSQSKNVREGDHGKMQKKRNGHVITKDSKEKKAKKDEKKLANDQEAPTGYIHVRARRGQATDSHSLAERVRREKISERMKVLQTLVPGCDKVTGKALMLDEIINYVQSLQNQVEFLSMKLASLNPMYYDFGMELDALMVRPDQSLSCLGAPVANPNSSSYPLLDSSASFMLQQFHFSNPISQ